MATSAAAELPMLCAISYHMFYFRFSEVMFFPEFSVMLNIVDRELIGKKKFCQSAMFWTLKRQRVISPMPYFFANKVGNMFGYSRYRKSISLTFRIFEVSNFYGHACKVLDCRSITQVCIEEREFFSDVHLI